MNMSDDYRKSLADFVSKYVEVKEGYRYDEDDVIEQAISLIVENNVLTPKEIQRQALKDHSIVIPKHFIDKCVKFG